MKALIDVTLKESILDPQGAAVKEGLLKLGYHVEGVRIGKHIEVELKDMDIKEAEGIIKDMCEKLLINPVIETYTFRFEV
ncbi:MULTISPECIES: phosphoribosylformylglycinamidine synthase subunit PurS [unclassified Caloramator]|jgi:phosphoribosylformylglycinamidine synthase PurS subunit|uniref:phosphoribosylformylglycinamidine synthase subunit PurS n=1 Tax=unclassified Caloramator TaxID=2629145 RepID=UPI00237DACFE|nr:MULTISPECIES: phosphoribosylformylglycinamidine synthase subunit PurS [unclassified Caloramator]MDO6354824.1 phosphoribosylformylglycinamidine synthase subunit PurS [Caloramator sp. CAR-1]WDU83049.1 phosphoribosylformylglycinamidine synthase subunit PurS [Caloramator sp. Dgby_cultured_2]